MKRKTRSRLVALFIACTAGGMPSAALAWAGGGHAYIALHSAKRAGLTDPNEMCNRVYGAVAVDLFNFDFTPTGFALQGLLHGEGNATAAEAWDVANAVPAPTSAELAFAYGFASHNDGWGTDFVAHWSGKTLDPAEGYVVTKARQLAALLPPDAVALIGGERIPIVTHVLVEYSMDLLLAEAEPSLGARMIEAASLAPFPGYACPQPAGTRVLVDTLVPHVATIVGDDLAEATVLDGDLVSRQVLFALGSALAQPTAAARRDAVAVLVASLAGAFLGPLPPEVTPDHLKALVAQLLDAGKLVAAGDLMGEIEATIGRVNGKMSSLGIAP